MIEFVRMHAARRPDAFALVDAERCLTWSQLAREVSRRAATLPSARDLKVPMVALHRPGDTCWVVDFLALRSTGLVVLALPDAMPVAAAHTLARDLGAAALVGATQVCLFAGQPGAASWQDLGEPALVHLTSGTTGTARGVLRDRANLEDEADAVATALALGEAPVLMGTPVSHSFASGLLLAALTAGSPSLLVPRFDPSVLIRLALEHRPKTLAGTPYIFRAVAGSTAVRAAGLPGLKFPLSGGAPLHPIWAADWAEATGMPICQEYGLSEGGIATMNLADAAQMPDSVGRPVPRVRLHVVDDEQRPVATGKSGHVVVERPFNPVHYLIAGGAVEEVPTVPGAGAPGIWTGDLGSLDAAGRLRLNGRVKTLINVGGAKVSPYEVERHLLSCPHVRDAVAVGIADPERGEAVAVLLQTDPGTTIAQVSAHLRERLSSFAMPRRWAFIDTIPRTVSNKPDRAKARTILEG